MIRVRSLLLGLLCLSCGDSRTWIPPPPGAAEGSMVVSVEAVATPPAPTASAGASPVEIVIEGDIPDGARLVARVFRESLATLQIPAGDLPPAGDDVRSLEHERSFEFSLADAEPQREWIEFEVSPLLAPALDTSCPPLELISHGLDTTAPLSFAFALDGERAWVGAQDRSLFEVTETDVRRLEDVDPALPLDVAHNGPAGDIWLAGAEGQVFRAHAGSSSISGSLVLSDPSVGPIRWIGGGLIGEGRYEIFALTEDGLVLRIDGADGEVASAATELHRFDATFARRGGGMAWLGPGRAVVASEWSEELLFIEGGERSFERPPLAALTSVTSVAHSPIHGVLAGGSLGGVAQKTEEWRYLGDGGHRFLVHALFPDETGFFMFGSLGFAAFYDFRAERFCAPEKIGVGTIYAVAALDRHLVVVDVKHNPELRTYARLLAR